MIVCLAVWDMPGNWAECYQTFQHSYPCCGLVRRSGTLRCRRMDRTCLLTCLPTNVVEFGRKAPKHGRRTWLEQESPDG